MDEKKYDKDLFEFFSKLIDDPEELDLLKKIMRDVDGEKIIKEYVKSQEDQEND